MAIVKTIQKIKVPCYYHFHDGQDPEKCERCSFLMDMKKIIKVI